MTLAERADPRDGPAGARDPDAPPVGALAEAIGVAWLQEYHAELEAQQAARRETAPAPAGDDPRQAIFARLRTGLAHLTRRDREQDEHRLTGAERALRQILAARWLAARPAPEPAPEEAAFQAHMRQMLLPGRARPAPRPVGSPAEEAAFQARLDAILFRHATPRRGGPAYLRPLIQALRDAPSWARGRVWRCALGECRAWFLDTSRAGRKEFCGRSHAVRAWKLTTRTTPSWLR